jgi:MFS family permease
MTRAAGWLGLNRATLGVLVVVGGLGMSEEIWRNFLAIHLRDVATGMDRVLSAAKYMGLFAAAVNLLEGFGYILGGTIAHRMGARAALLVSALPMLAGFAILLLTRDPLLVILGALLLTNWEAISVPATFDVVGSEVPKERRTIAFAMQSIQKRLPKVLGPLVGGLVMAVGYWVNLTAALGLVAISCLLQFLLLSRMKPKKQGPQVPWRDLVRAIPPELKTLLSAEIVLRWGDWFVRDFAVLYVVGVLMRSKAEAGALIAVTSVTALVTYVPIGKLVDRARSPKPFIGLPKILPSAGVPVLGALVVVFVLNGLRELGEPARKALIAGGFAPEVRARSVGLYWGLRSFAFFPAPVVSYLLWSRLGPEATFLAGGGIGLVGTAWFWLRVKA